MKRIFSILLFATLAQASFKDQNNYHLYFWANYNQSKKDQNEARKCYQLIFSNNPTKFAFPGFIHHLAEIGQFQGIVDLMPTVQRMLTPGLDIQLLFAQALEHIGNFEAADELLIKLAQEHQQNAEVVYYAAVALVRSNKLSEAIKLINSFLENNTEQHKNYVFHFLKAQILANEDKKAEAAQEVAKAVELNPAFSQGWLFLGLLHEQLETFDKAIAALKQCLTIMGSNPLLERHIVQLQLQHAPHEASPASEHNLQLGIIMQLIANKEYARSLTLINQLLQSDDQVSHRLVKIELLCRMGKVQEGLTYLLSCIDTDPTNAIWFKAVHMMSKAGADDALITKTFEKVITTYPTNLLAHIYHADFHLSRAHDTQALQALNNALPYVTDPKTRTTIYFQIGRLHIKNNAWQEASSALKAGEELKESYPPLLNALAYYYATKGNDLATAQLLIADALQQDPDNPHFLDTQALIWYKENNLEQAHNQLQQLMQKTKNDWYIYAHSAKISHKMGNKQQAKESLNQAIALTPYEHKKKKYQHRIIAWQL